MKATRNPFEGVPRIGQGTWNLRGPEAVRALRRGLDLGLTHIDTAEMYGTEETVAEAIAGRRDEVFLVSKVLPSNATRRGTVRACEQSLQRLKTDRLDCYLLHWPGSHPLAETIAGFEELVAAGKIRSYGVSNFDEEQVREAASLGNIACNQVLYNLGERHVEARVFPVCRELGIACVGYSPLAELPAGDFGDATPAQVALAFLAREAFQIPKAATVAHVEENAGALSLKLSAAQVKRLDAAYPVHVRRELPTS